MKALAFEACRRIVKFRIRDHKLIVTVMLVLSFYSMMAQVTLRGNVRTENDQPLPFATVALFSGEDSTLVAGTATNEEGTFYLSVRTGDYVVNAAMVGYRTNLSRIKIDVTKDTVHLGNLYLSEDITQLDEIIISGQKALIEKQLDRTVINIQRSITAAGSTALEVLEKSPGIVVNRQNNSIAMSGKTGVLVMVNGKVTRLPTEAVIQMLNGMSSDNIEKIELITTPPAKYDAEGNAGIIHIVMNENPEKGFNGRFGLTLGYARKETMGSHGNLSYRSKRLNSFLNYSIHYERNRHRWITTHSILSPGIHKTNTSNSDRKPVSTVQNLRAGVEYRLTPKTTISLLATWYRRNWDLAAITTNINSTAADSIWITNMSILEINRWQSGTGSVEFNHRLGEHQEIHFTLDYLSYHNNNPSSYDNKTFFNASSDAKAEIIKVTKQTPINFKIASVDYTNTFNTNLSMDAGIKGTVSRFTNHVTATRESNGELKIDPELSNRSKLDEKILAAYGAWRWQPVKHWNVDGGLRYEYTNTFLSTPDGVVVDRTFGNIFPSLFIRYGISEHSVIQAAYSKRITRPTFNDMAPFVFFIGPNTFVSGNLTLKPATSDGVDLSYRLNQWWVSLKYSYSRNEIVMFQPEYNEFTNEQIFRSQNLPYVQTFGVNTTFPVAVSSWWEIQTDVSFYLHYYRTQHQIENVRRRLNSLIINMTHSFALPKEFSLEISGYYQSASVLGIFQYKPIGKLNAGIKKRFKNSAAITLSVNDIFNTSIWNFKTDPADVDSKSSFLYDWGTRSINLTYSFSFGNSKLKAVNIKSSSDAERKRVQ